MNCGFSFLDQDLYLGIIAKGINAIIKIGAVLPILLLRNIGCGKKDTIEKEQSDFDGTVPPNRTKDRRECIKPPEIRDLQHTGNLIGITKNFEMNFSKLGKIGITEITNDRAEKG